MKYLIILLAITTMACSKDGGGAAAPASKSLFSLWTGADGITDFTGMGFGENVVDIAVDATSGCLCTLDIVGDQAGGTLTLHTCLPYGAATCAAGSVLYGYAIVDSVLAICSASSCSEYR